MITCLIPARGGSKSIPLKNIKDVNGKPLIWWTLNAANNSIIDKIYVSTDNDDIKRVVNSFGFDKVEVINRSEFCSTDKASTESVMIEFAESYKFDNLVLIQPTSPLLKTEHINEAVNEFLNESFDSLLSLVRQFNFQWEENEDKSCTPSNYDFMKRPRRQDHNGYMIENGAFYITTAKAFNESKCRVSGKIGFYEMPSYTYFEIDEESDITIIEELLERYG